MFYILNQFSVLIICLLCYSLSFICYIITKHWCFSQPKTINNKKRETNKINGWIMKTGDPDEDSALNTIIFKNTKKKKQNCKRTIYIVLWKTDDLIFFVFFFWFCLFVSSFCICCIYLSSQFNLLEWCTFTNLNNIFMQR